MTPCGSRLLSLGVVALLALGAQPADAGCNVIPGTSKTFAASLGATNRPFAAPGEPVTLRLRTCDGSSGFLAAGDDHVVTLAFRPPGGTPRIVALSTNCTQVSEAACGPSAVCKLDLDLAVVVDPQAGDRRLVFRMPDTDLEFIPDDDNRTLSGPVAIAVTPLTDPLPCALATTACASLTGPLACVDELFVDDGDCGTAVPHPFFSHFMALPPPNDYRADCFSQDPPCTAAATELRFTADTAGNLLFPVNWQGVLVNQGTVPVPRLLRTRLKSPLPFEVPAQVFLGSFAPEGARLPPIFEPQLDTTVADPDVVTFFGSVDAPSTVLQIARHHGTCVGGSQEDKRCTRDGDCPEGTCETSCVDDPNTFCTTDGQCPSGVCGKLFDFDALAALGGPLVLPRTTPAFCQLPPHQDCSGNPGLCTGVDNLCVSYALEAQTPVPLEGLEASDAARSFTLNEANDLTDRNGDGDTIDSVVTLRDRETGLLQPLGAPPVALPPGCGVVGTVCASGTTPGAPCTMDGDCGGSGTCEPEGRAVIRVSQPPFSFPAVAVENDVLAFLESEAATNDAVPPNLGCDENADLDSFDAILGVLRLGAGELPLSPLRAVDAALLVNGRTLAVSDGLVFFRTSEAAMARRLTERMDVATDGSLGNGAALPSAISADGNVVAFISNSINLLPGGADTNGSADVFVHERSTGVTERVSVTTGGGQLMDVAEGGLPPVFLNLSLSANGRFVVFDSTSTKLLGPGGDTNDEFDVFLHDRTTDVTERVSVTAGGMQAEGGGSFIERSRQSISADGRFVVFWSVATNLVGVDSGFDDIFVRDRCFSDGVAVPSCTPTTERVSVASNGDLPNGFSGTASISANGRFVAFYSAADNLEPNRPDNNFVSDVFVHDRETGETKRVSVATDGAEANGASSGSAISGNGRFVAFNSGAINLVGDDTNGVIDVFVHDRETGITERVSVATGGAEGGDFVIDSSISEDGRFVAFRSLGALAPGTTPGNSHIYVRDRLTATTEFVSVGLFALDPFISADGSVVTFHNGNFVWARGADANDPLEVDTLLFPDGELDDTVLEVFDTVSPAVTTLCPAEAVSVAAGNAAFLRPEAPVGTMDCPGGALNGDGLTDDLVVHLWQGTEPTPNLGRAGVAVSLSPTWVAALISEEGDGAFYNPDADQADTVVQVHRVTDAPGTWTNTAQAADAVEMSDTVAVFITPEADQEAVLNGDGLEDDRVLQAFYAEGPSPNLENIGEAAEEFVVAPPTPTTCGTRHLVAFRTSEAAENQNLNAASGDIDLDDDVLQIFDLETRTLTNTGQAVTPCRLAACDPRRPYRISGSQVRFLTFEGDQGPGGGLDLNGDGTTNQLLVHLFDVCSGALTVLDAVDENGDSTDDPLEEQEESLVFETEAGRCAVEPEVTCDPNDPLNDSCAAGTFCSPTGDRCVFTFPGSCRDDADCPPGAVCAPETVTVAIGTGDGDGDGVPDVLDLCPENGDPSQDDADADGVGDVCDAAPGTSCSPGPLLGCLPPGGSGKSQLQIKDKDADGPGSKDKIQWKWLKGPGLSQGDFGDPTDPNGPDFKLCIYAGATPSVIVEMQVPSGGTCGTKACWKPISTKGYKYGDKGLASDGVKKLLLKGDVAGKSKILIQGKDGNLPLPTLPLDPNGPVIAQLSSSDPNLPCYEETFLQSNVIKNEAKQFKAKTP